MRLLARNRRRSVGRALVLAAGLVPLIPLGLGCELPDLAAGARREALAEASAVEEHRQKFLTEGDPKAIRWLLANHVGSGMTRDEVESILGAHGERVFNDAWLKSGTTVRQTDNTYRWGPDNAGQTYYLFFRDDRLVNYDPDEYRG